jgi:hypothetical protein
MIADAQDRLQEASQAYADTLDRQLKVFKDIMVTEDTLRTEMTHASQAHRDRLKKMKAYPPLVTDEDRLQLQVKCAAAEEKGRRTSERSQSFSRNL